MPQNSVVNLVLAALLGVAAPCQAGGEPRGPVSGVRPGIVVTVEGIGGLDMLGPNATASLRKAGLPHEVYNFRWSHGTGRFLIDLQDTQHLLKKADELAQVLIRLREEAPQRPIYVIAKSAGTGLTLFALNQVPPGTVDRTVLISAAVSPSFDLRQALRATRGEVVARFEKVVQPQHERIVGRAAASRWLK